ncbi:MAG: hypothetical protein D5R99_05985 [Methanocalculus sp. MSAO_Arc1]|nr:MAG: hypothetical protein D5R99_05985 [Methanocalculus sp. MSAO_Arc1]
MLQTIAYTQVFGLSLLAVLGILLLVSLLTTASIAVLKRSGKIKVPFTWHFWMARLTIMIALVHGILGLSPYLGL